MIIVVTGAKGEGKTLFLTYLTHLLYMKHNVEVISNYKLIHIPFTKLSIKQLFLHMLNHEVITNKVINMDEMQTLLDSRKFGSDINLLISYFALQTRKTNVYLCGTTQNFSMIEKRLRDNTDVLIECESYELINGKLIKLIEGRAKNPLNVLIKAHIYKRRDNKFIKVRILNLKANPIYQLYDTSQVIQLDEMKIKQIMNKIEKNKLM